MAEQETDHDRLIRIEAAVEAIKETLVQRPPIRHINKDGICDAYDTVISHDRRMNQWVGFVAAISILFSVIGGAIVMLFSWLTGKP